LMLYGTAQNEHCPEVDTKVAFCKRIKLARIVNNR